MFLILAIRINVRRDGRLRVVRGWGGGRSRAVDSPIGINTSTMARVDLLSTSTSSGTRDLFALALQRCWRHKVKLVDARYDRLSKGIVRACRLGYI